MAKIDVNLNGQKFGRWTVLETIPKHHNKLKINLYIFGIRRD